jgi:hypothetical protein
VGVESHYKGWISIADLKFPLHKAHSKVSKSQIDPKSLVKDNRDPAGRVPVREEVDFKLPIPGKITSLRGSVHPSERVRKSRDKKEEKLSDFL